VSDRADRVIGVAFDDRRGYTDVLLDDVRIATLVNIPVALKKCSTDVQLARAKETLTSELHSRDRFFAEFGCHDYGEAGA
jgi:hypothetical protein